MQGKDNAMVIGLMSGTSMDGLDICACEFTTNQNSIDFRIIHAETIPYSEEWRRRLNNATQLSGEDLTKLHHQLGIIMAKPLRPLSNETAYIQL